MESSQVQPLRAQEGDAIQHTPCSEQHGAVRQRRSEVQTRAGEQCTPSPRLGSWKYIWEITGYDGWQPAPEDGGGAGDLVGGQALSDCVIPLG